MLNGSPQKEKSVTLVICREVVQGVIDATGAAAEYINISDLNIKPCLGCLSCWGRTEGTCVIKGDDIAAVKQKVLDADYVFESFPLYFFGMPGSVKVFTDRMLSMMKTYEGQIAAADGQSLHGVRYPNPNRKFVIVSSCAYSEAEGAYAPLIKQFDCICGKGNYTPIIVPQLKTTLDSAKGARLEKYLKMFRDAGRKLATEPLTDSDLRALAKGPFTNPTYKILLGKYWESERSFNK